jgi:leucyl/phenylalanyl-tRNA--protein transferase
MDLGPSAGHVSHLVKTAWRRNLAVPFRHNHSILDLIAKAPYPIRQGVLGSAYLLVPRRLPGLLPLAAVTMRDLPHIGRPLIPDPSLALDHPDGLCGLTGRIGVPELLTGYGRGMFVMSHTGPLKWWAPRHRMVLFFDHARIEKTTRRLLRAGRFRVTFDRAFGEVMRACASPRSGGTPLTWITRRVQALFEKAHTDGYAHSIEVWEDDVLAGGIYGLAVGRLFFTESQFHKVRDASKVGFAVLNRHLQAWGFALNDGKHPTRYLADCGMKPVTRSEFSRLCEVHSAARGRVGRWGVDPALTDDRWEPAEVLGLRMQDVLAGGSTCPWSVEELLSTQRSWTW